MLSPIPRPSVSIIGSREQLCIHGEVSKKETNAEKVSSFPLAAVALEEVMTTATHAGPPVPSKSQESFLLLLQQH